MNSVSTKLDWVVPYRSTRTQLPVRWELTVQRFVDGRFVGARATGIAVYPSGQLLIPGEPAMYFPDADTAKAFAETMLTLKQADEEEP